MGSVGRKSQGSHVPIDIFRERNLVSGKGRDMEKITRNTTTEENQRFWKAVDQNTQTVENWPDGKKGWVRTPVAASSTQVDVAHVKASPTQDGD
jgi:hypothetical protein